MSDAAVAIRRALDRLSDLPTSILAWEVTEGLDSTDDPAVWICAVIPDPTFDATTYRTLTDRARTAALLAAPELWPYVSVRSAAEQGAAK